jgi:Lon protease-like protein
LDEEGVDIRFEQLPAVLPIFPLSGVLLLPRGVLPLNIFEPRYLAMTRDAMGGERLIGMVQPAEPDAPEPPPVFSTGCAGKITSFAETPDRRFLITLTGVIRFAVRQELPLLRGYRRVVPDWAPFRDDLAPPSAPALDRERLERALRIYFKQHGLDADWEAVRQTPDERLVTSLAMICPFSPAEKQALVEAKSLAERAATLLALIEIAALEGDSSGAAPH